MGHSNINPHPSALAGRLTRPRPNWSKLEQHLQEVGALHTGIYCLLRDLTPAAVLSGYWIYRHPGVLLHGPKWLSNQRISLVELLLLVAVTLLAQLVNSQGWGTPHHPLHREISSTLATATFASCLVFPALLANHSSRSALLIDIDFLLGSTMLRLALLAVTAAIGLAAADVLVSRREVLLIGSGRGARGVFDDLIDSPVYHLTGVLDDQFIGSGLMRDRYLGPLSQLESTLKENPVSIVYCSLPVKSMYESIQHVIETCERFGVEVRHSSRLFQTSIARLVPGHREAFSILHMVRQDSTRYVKRVFDIAGASTLLILTSPILFAAAIAIRATSPGPILFTQQRYGLYRRRFHILKLRTMVPDAELLQAGLEDLNELDGPAFKIRRDPRITRIGAFLRKTSIDELPQLWNVLRGDMSLVGPRPLTVRDVLLIRNSSQLRRFSVLPGITCIWQIAGRNNTDFESWIRQDLEYIDNWSLSLDLRILFGTIPAVLGTRGAM